MMRNTLPPLASNDLLYGDRQRALRGFDVIREASGFGNRQPVFTHSVEVKFNRFTHALPEFFDGFPGSDTTRQIGEVS